MSRALVVMTLLSSLTLSLGSYAEEPSSPRPVLVLDLERRGGVSEDDARTLSTMVATALSQEPGLSVIAGEAALNDAGSLTEAEYRDVQLGASSRRRRQAAPVTGSPRARHWIMPPVTLATRS